MRVYLFIENEVKTSEGPVRRESRSVAPVEAPDALRLHNLHKCLSGTGIDGFRNGSGSRGVARINAYLHALF